LIDVLIQNDDRVIGIAYRGIAKAYPIKILNWHEIVNDSFAGNPVTVTNCPLCNSGIAYDAVIKDKNIFLAIPACCITAMFCFMIE
jgi:Protein of unknown function (DUF3179)